MLILCLIGIELGGMGFQRDGVQRKLSIDYTIVDRMVAQTRLSCTSYFILSPFCVGIVDSLFDWFWPWWNGV